jgi:hypothetical protein
MLNQRLQSLIDDRVRKAAKGDLSKKLQTIVKAFGKPIIEQTIPYNSLPDFWEIEAPEIMEASDDNVYLRGYYFDGLNRGINICIKTVIYEGHLSEIRVTYNGYQVFLEADGELKSYVPFESWEDAVERLYNYAKPASEEKIKEEKVKEKKQAQKRVMSLLDSLRTLWGIDIGK